MTRLRSAAVCLGAVVVLLGACSGDDDDDTSSSSDDTSSTTEAASEESSSSDEDATPAIVSAANAFLEMLSDEQKESVLFDFTDTEQRQRWSNFPQGLFTREGLMWGDLNEESQNAWLALMQATLSEDGYNRVRAEWTADDHVGGDGQCCYGMQYYWVALIGTPSETDPWQWQWGGHHVTVNATVVGSDLAITPSFIGVEPATYDSDGSEVRPLGDIDDQAFTLINSLDSTQQGKAILGDESIDLVLGPGEDGRTIEAEGLPGSEMNDEQKAELLQLMEYYGGLANDEDAAERMSELESEIDDTYLAWYGPTAEGSASYFRVTGPSVVIEYSPQTMGPGSGDATNHVHGIYRDPANDYGAEWGAGLDGT